MYILPATVARPSSDDIANCYNTPGFVDDVMFSHINGAASHN